MYIVYIYAHWPLPIYATGHCPFFKKKCENFCTKNGDVGWNKANNSDTSD